MAEYRPRDQRNEFRSLGKEHHFSSRRGRLLLREVVSSSGLVDRDDVDAGVGAAHDAG